MKRSVSLLLSAIAILSCKKSPEAEYGNFKSEKVSKTASFVVNDTIEKVFPLFGAFEERKWETNWDPILIYPDQEIIEEGTSFKIKGHGHDNETEFLWIVTKYDPELHLIQYLVSTPNRYWTITVKCKSLDNEMKTNITVTYSYFGLNEKGNELNTSGLEKMYQRNLQDWADAINNYLKRN